MNRCHALLFIATAAGTLANANPASAKCLQPEDYTHGVAYLELGATPDNLCVSGDKLFVQYGEELAQIDAADPEHMSLLGVCAVPEGISAISSMGITPASPSMGTQLVGKLALVR